MRISTIIKKPCPSCSAITDVPELPGNSYEFQRRAIAQRLAPQGQAMSSRGCHPISAKIRFDPWPRKGPNREWPQVLTCARCPHQTLANPNGVDPLTVGPTKARMVGRPFFPWVSPTATHGSAPSVPRTMPVVGHPARSRSAQKNRASQRVPGIKPAARPPWE